MMHTGYFWKFLTFNMCSNQAAKNCGSDGQVKLTIHDVWMIWKFNKNF